MRLSSRSRSILTEARRLVEVDVGVRTVEVIVLQPGEEPPPPVDDDGIVQYIIRLTDKDHPLAALDKVQTV